MISKINITARKYEKYLDQFNYHDTVAEKDYQTEREMHDEISKFAEKLFAVKIIANEYEIQYFDNELQEQKTGRIDSLGIDENGFPTIIEYKLNSKSNIINQALYYLDC